MNTTAWVMAGSFIGAIVLALGVPALVSLIRRRKA